MGPARKVMDFPCKMLLKIYFKKIQSAFLGMELGYLKADWQEYRIKNNLGFTSEFYIGTYWTLINTWMQLEISIFEFNQNFNREKLSEYIRKLVNIERECIA